MQQQQHHTKTPQESINQAPATNYFLAKHTICQPELLQPTILGVSLTYIMYTIFAGLKLLPEMWAATQFTYYVCIISFVTVIFLYLKFSLPESKLTKANWIYIILLMLTIAMFIGYCFVKLPSKYFNVDKCSTH